MNGREGGEKDWKWLGKRREEKERRDVMEMDVKKRRGWAAVAVGFGGSDFGGVD